MFNAVRASSAPQTYGNRFPDVSRLATFYSPLPRQKMLPAAKNVQDK
jgi:hypothetical protein